MSGKPLMKVSHQIIWDQIEIHMSSFWNNFAISQDEMELVVSASKDARDILTQLDKKTESARTMIDILNENSYKELQYLAIRDRTNLVI